MGDLAAEVSVAHRRNSPRGAVDLGNEFPQGKLTSEGVVRASMRSAFSAHGCLSLGCLSLFLAGITACSSGGQAATPLDGGGVSEDADVASPGAVDAAAGHDAGVADGSKTHSTSGPLSIVSLTPTATTLTGGEALVSESSAITFIAIVTDDAGLDTIAGGQLMDDTGATYAAFGAGANKGTYSATLTWAEMTSVHAASFGPQGGSRKFVAKFVDNAHNEVTSEVDIGLACRRGSGLVSSCAGICSDLRDDVSHCGACGTSCSSAQFCAAGLCNAGFTTDPASPTHVQTACIAPSAFASSTTCAQLCERAKMGACTRILQFGASDATCGGASSDGSCTADVTQVPGPIRCRCNAK